jgi:hypothetical protein
MARASGRHTDGLALGPSRWRGQRGRVEVWYVTATDDATGTGLWLHHELVAPVDGGAEPYAHGWVALFPPDRPPVERRFGPTPVPPAGVGRDGAWFSACGTVVTPTRLAGDAGDAGDTWWDLTVDTHAADAARPLWTFPRPAWERELLPAAQVVALPAARFAGTVTVATEAMVFSGTGALARIYGHGNALRWAWLHGDLGGGDLVEVVTAVSRRPGLRRLPAAPLVRFRIAGRDQPAVPLAVARSRLELPRWSLTGTSGRQRLSIEVEIPADRAVTLRYTDPDGATATCTNSERATADVTLGDRHWVLDGTAHAEVGLRP